MNIVLFNVKYSNNVGDGIVAETTEYVLKHLDPNANVTCFDLGGRTEFGGSGIASPSFLKQIVHKFLGLLPSKISDPLRVFLTQKALFGQVGEKWADAIECADHIIIGGGQLIADTDLYFPIRLNMIMQLAQKFNTPIYIHAVGVSNSKNFSDIGRGMMEDIFKNNPLVKYVSVRDVLSQTHYHDAFDVMANIVPDTGLFSADTYGVSVCHENTGQTVGIGVMSAEAVHSHTSAADKKVVLSVTDYIDLGLSLVKQGYRPVYFTNGAPEDHEVLEQVQAQFPNPSEVCFAQRPITPKDLVHIIAGCSKVIAHRLHATIIATSLGLPIIGFQWDKKLKSFFAHLKKEEYCPDHFDLERTVELVKTASPAEVTWDIEAYRPLL